VLCTSLRFPFAKVLLFCATTVGPPRSQARRNLLVRHIPPAAFHKTTTAGWRRGTVEHGDEDIGRWRELFRLLCFHLEEKVNHNIASGRAFHEPSCYPSRFSRGHKSWRSQWHQWSSNTQTYRLYQLPRRRSEYAPVLALHDTQIYSHVTSRHI
jgi:hypothetical protein